MDQGTWQVTNCPFIVTECQELLMKSIEVLVCQMLANHLERGRYHNADSTLQKETKSVPKTNTISKREVWPLATREA